jgi:predicted dehydrogenase
MGRNGTVGVGVVGRGFGANVVAPVYAELDGCTVVDVVSPRDDAAVRALCEHPDVDLVSVHSPPFLHPSHVDLALGAGKALVCDKPFGRNADDAAAMQQAADDAGALALLNFEFRHHPGRIALRQLLRDGAVGTVEHVQWTVFGAGFRVPLRPYGWLFDAERGGGWIGAWGSHVIDFLRWTLGDLVDASARLRTDIIERPDADGVMHTCTAEDGFTALLRTADGASITIDTSFVAVKNSPPRVVVLGSEGTLESIADGRITLRNSEGTHEVFSFEQPREDPHLVPMRAWGAVVRDAVRSGKVPEGEPTFVDGVECARVMDALRAVRA